MRHLMIRLRMESRYSIHWCKTGFLPVKDKNIKKIRKPRHPQKNGKWYSEGLKFTCKQCAACCSGEPGFVWTTSDEIRKIAEYLEISEENFKEQFIRQAGTGYSLIEKPNGDCIFLSGKKCKIYPVRPIQCTTWPFWEANIATIEAWRKCCNACPGSGSGRHYTFSFIQKILLKNKRHRKP